MYTICSRTVIIKCLNKTVKCRGLNVVCTVHALALALQVLREWFGTTWTCLQTIVTGSPPGELAANCVLIGGQKSIIKASHRHAVSFSVCG